MIKFFTFFISFLILMTYSVSASIDDAKVSVKKLISLKQKDMDIGVAFNHIESGKGFCIEKAKSYPLASVYKLPLMLTVLKKCENGSMSLKDMIEIRNIDICIGSGDLQFAPIGKKYSLSHLIYEMISVSDNTAADAIFNRLKRNECMDFLKSYGIVHTHVYIANRPAWLISLGEVSSFRGLSSEKIAKKWLSMSDNERFIVIDKACKENEFLSLEDFQKIEDASGELGNYDGDVICAEALDNIGTPSDFVSMLSDLWNGNMLGPDMRSKALYYLSSCKYNTRIPARLPKGVKVWHKTGTISGCVNDTGIVEFSPSSHGAIAVFIRNIKRGKQKEATELIAEISKIIYDNCK